MYKMLYISEEFEPFRSSWGSMAIAQPHDSGWVMPLGWEEELSIRNIDFDIIEIEIPKDED